MGLFGKLFEKKECAICGGEIGLLGNRKLEDGNMCKACAAKLSPWFDERRHSTVAQIEEQLEYRESNKENVAAFRTTLSLGETASLALRLVQIHPLTWPFAGFADTRLYHRQQQTATKKVNQT